MAEIDEKTQFHSGRFQVVIHLSAVLIGQFLDRLDLYDNAIEADEVGSVGLFQPIPFILQNQFPLSRKGNSQFVEFCFQAFLIYRLQKPASHLTIHFEGSPSYLITFLFKY
jgi:hypothetical protein